MGWQTHTIAALAHDERRTRQLGEVGSDFSVLARLGILGLRQPDRLP